MQWTLAAALLLQLQGVAAFAPRVVPLSAGHTAWRARPCARAPPLHMLSWPSWGGARGAEEKREELKKSLRRLVAQTKQGKGANDAERVPSPGARTAARAPQRAPAVAVYACNACSFSYACDLCESAQSGRYDA